MHFVSGNHPHSHTRINGCAEAVRRLRRDEGVWYLRRDGGVRCLCRDDASDLAVLNVFNVGAYECAGELGALTAAGADVQLLLDVAHGFGAAIERTTDGLVGHVVADANDHGDAPPHNHFAGSP